MFIPFTIGGGVRSLRMPAVLDAGADKVAVNSARTRAARVGGRAGWNPRLPVRGARDRRQAAIEWRLGGLRDGRAHRHGCRRSGVGPRGGAAGGGGDPDHEMDRDGTTEGYDLELTSAVADAVSVPVIASGGAGAPTTSLQPWRPARSRPVCVHISLRPPYGGRGQTAAGADRHCGPDDLLSRLFHVPGGRAGVAICGWRHARLVAPGATAGRGPLGATATNARCSGVLELFAHAI